MIQVKYLASLAEILGKEKDTLNWQEGFTPEKVWTKLNPTKTLPSNTICAVNFSFFDKSKQLNDNCELAFFPPVTGG